VANGISHHPMGGKGSGGEKAEGLNVGSLSAKGGEVQYPLLKGGDKSQVVREAPSTTPFKRV